LLALRSVASSLSIGNPGTPRGIVNEGLVDGMVIGRARHACVLLQPFRINGTVVVCQGHCNLVPEDMMSFVAVSLLGYNFRASLALGVLAVIVIGVALVWFVTSKDRDR
jgi:hypothetical protein